MTHHRTFPLSAFTLALVLAPSILAGPLAAQPTFTDITAEAGLGPYRFISAHDHGGGVVWIDFDRDGWPDLFATNGFGQVPHLFQNDQDGTFTNRDDLLPTLANVELMGAAFADYDNDGDSDIYIFVDNELKVPMSPDNPLDGPPNILLKNLWVENGGNEIPGQPLFEDVAAAAGVDNLAAAPFGPYPGYRSATGGWVDYDRDGWVDLYVGNWCTQHPGEACNQDFLYHNNGDGTFSDVTTAVGLHDDSDPNFLRATLAFVAANLTDDRGTGNRGFYWPDLYVAHVEDPAPFHHDFYYTSDFDGTFTDTIAESPGTGDDTEAAMGIAVGDVDRDGNWDIYISDLLLTTLDAPPPGNALYLGTGDGFTDNVAEAAGVLADASWGVNLFDVDSDGWEDLFVGTIGSRENYLFMNDQDGTFTDMGVAAGVAYTGNVRGSAVADLDRDGDLDLAVTHSRGRLRILRNDTPRNGNSFRVTLKPTISNRDAIGTVVDLRFETGEILRRQVIGGSSAHSQDATELVFGTGDRAVIPLVKIWWPSDAVPAYHNVPADLSLEFEELSFPEAGVFDFDQVTGVGRFRLSRATRYSDDNIEFSVDLGAGTWLAIAGDWDGDGIDSVGVFDQATQQFRLWNGHAGGPADIELTATTAGGTWFPIAGDWDGDGIDTVGLWTPDGGLWVLAGDNVDFDDSGAFQFGATDGTGFFSLAGDWNGDDIDSIGTYEPATGMAVISNTNDMADVQSFRVDPRRTVGWDPVVGDWDGDGIDLPIGLLNLGNPGTNANFIHLRRLNLPFEPDVRFYFGFNEFGIVYQNFTGKWG